MGRLFWKFFLFIWLLQLLGMLGVGTVFWLEHQHPESFWAAHLPGGEAGPGNAEARGAEFAGAPPHGLPHNFPGDSHRPPRPPYEDGFRIPLLPFLGALLASLGCALGLAWYFAKPIRQLHGAFDAAAGGDLEVRIGDLMGGRRDELANLGRDFDRMTARLASSMNAQRDLLHDVSHEMRSPLARLQVAIGLARQQPARLEDSLGRIERESQRMDVLVGELLTLSRLDAGVMGVQENIDMSELLANIVEDARFEGAARGLQIDLITGEIPEIRANAELLHRSIENIVRNAVRYSPPGGVIRIEAGATGDYFRLRVSDQGPGVPEGDLASIFKPFFRGPGQALEGGHGLGLAIAARVVGMLRGGLRAENRREGGLCVEMQLALG
jgi:signal transduction histidine kinase